MLVRPPGNALAALAIAWKGSSAFWRVPTTRSYKYLGEDPPDEPETVVRLIVRMTPQKVLDFAP
jgi:hypothetical protein